jgi:hypothetical protein
MATPNPRPITPAERRSHFSRVAQIARNLGFVVSFRNFGIFWRRCYDRNKKLSTIRKEIELALASTGEDPIQSLERQIATAKNKGVGTEVMEGLKQFLASPQKRKHGKMRRI